MQPSNDSYFPLLKEAAQYTGAIALMGSLLVGVFYLANRPRVDPTATEPATLAQASAFDQVQIKAKAVYVYDVTTQKVLYARNEEVQLPLASITKVMTALTAKALLPAHSIVAITPDDIREEGDSGFQTGEAWDIDQILHYTLVVSSNDGARAIANAAAAVLKNDTLSLPNYEDFVQAMNRKALQLGLSQTYFLNASGVDVGPSLSGAYGSARDVTVLFETALREIPNTMAQTAQPQVAAASLSNIIHTGNNTNVVLNDIPRLIASKTGYTDLAGGNLVIAFDAGLNHPIIVTILGSSYEGRFADVRALAWAALEEVALGN